MHAGKRRFIHVMDKYHRYGVIESSVRSIAVSIQWTAAALAVAAASRTLNEIAFVLFFFFFLSFLLISLLILWWSSLSYLVPACLFPAALEALLYYAAPSHLSVSAAPNTFTSTIDVWRLTASSFVGSLPSVPTSDTGRCCAILTTDSRKTIIRDIAPVRKLTGRNEERKRKWGAGRRRALLASKGKHPVGRLICTYRTVYSNVSVETLLFSYRTSFQLCFSSEKMSFDLQ